MLDLAPQTTPLSAPDGAASPGDLARRDWLLLLIAHDADPGGLDGNYVHTAMCVFSEEAPISAAERYPFRPGLSGPTSEQIYEDMDWLEEIGHVERIRVRGWAGPRICVTPAGRERAAELLALATSRQPSAAGLLLNVKQEMLSMGMTVWMALVCRRHPQYAGRAIFNWRGYERPPGREWDDDSARPAKR
ncbi:hypothetical protein VSS74_00120 [Conexibacter stalactiti]|uniref:Uncharacterized protein n=1 Tax=Conexibacter stalactiti TaxID=1940611 RepID=A0ABU4HHC6_9ACTN|nr:hypothetical protein [Conexibacter stalactiti]MDW5592719.1 hypothetical protein [Conexibacter stalactiti]MEC5033360.1 hypothetical protein [Conexibacter stalactiti]